MDPEAVNAVAAELMPPDKYAWTVRPLSAHASVLTTHSTSDTEEAIELLDSGSGAFVLSIGDRVTYADYGYEDSEEQEVIREQLGRVRAYLDGAVTRTEKKHGERLISTRLDFPDGLTLTMNHAGVTSLINRIFGTSMSSARVEHRD